MKEAALLGTVVLAAAAAAALVWIVGAGFGPFFVGAFIVLAAAVLVWIVAAFFRSRCYVCRYRRATAQLASFPVCRQCFDWVERCRAITEGIESDTADMEIRQYRTDHPEAKL